MNQQEQTNIISADPFLQTFFLINNLYNQQIFQYMNSQVQCVPKVECREENTKILEDSNNDKKIQQHYYITSNQNQPLVRTSKGVINKGYTHRNDVDTSQRVNGHWSQQEHQMYLQFVNDHQDILKSKYDKKSKKIFKLMSQSIFTRTATQCRSHHQKFNPLQKSKRKEKNNLRPIPTVITQEN
ncbi:unnamed protein product [Paramecium pentaurelia]|uniref:Myb-like domain-containing protein n=1 Tax=Paramecium pentaurelia TaxID=43138 RepID=A0A8S1Y2Q7_9CILI|nr:unnamed protein product [Paramecium pentaurelia]